MHANLDRFVWRHNGHNGTCSVVAIYQGKRSFTLGNILLEIDVSVMTV